VSIHLAVLCLEYVNCPDVDTIPNILLSAKRRWQAPTAFQERSDLQKTIQVGPIPIPITPKENVLGLEPHGPDSYGTRLSTVILIRRDGQVLFNERDIWKIGEDGNVCRADPRSQRTYRFNIPINPGKAL